MDPGTAGTIGDSFPIIILRFFLFLFLSLFRLTPLDSIFFVIYIFFIIYSVFFTNYSDAILIPSITIILSCYMYFDIC